MRTEIYWVTESQRVELTSNEKPLAVWTYMGAGKPEPSIVPVHNHNAFFEDHIHDWRMYGSTLKYYSRVATHSVWIIVQYKDA